MGIEALRDYCRQNQLLMASPPQPEYSDDMITAVILGRLRHFEGELASSRAAVKELTQHLADRKLIERAKGVLMEEDVAFRRMQQTASKSNQKLVEVARAILVCNELAGDRQYAEQLYEELRRELSATK